ncbi:hypothetical protein [Fictibacillus sp. FJAT-27399]|uniref:hypothetical protein n=1 Tax=Fictibacillus sp. FJAT-27399 TaxID=1729689 RepID=UPI0012E352A6|nr:hypothetical protein [Fictibacillus sp. FJAT-27399]
MGLTHDLQIGPTLLVVILAMASVGAFFGSLLANYIGTRFKTGPTIFGAMFVACPWHLFSFLWLADDFTSHLLFLSFHSSWEVWVSSSPTFMSSASANPST